MKSVKLYGGLELKTELPFPDLPIEEMPAPEQIILPLSDRPGIFCRPLVERGETVFKGEKIAEDPTRKMLPVHSSVSGRVTEIKPYRYAEGGNTLSIFIESDGQDNYRPELEPIEDFANAEPVALIKAIREAGVKIIPFETLPEAERKGTKVTPVKHFVINGIGRGFAGTISRRLVVEKAPELVEAARLIQHIFHPHKIYLILNQEHEDAIEAAKGAGLDSEVEILALDVFYPLGHPHLLFKTLFNKEIPCPGGKAIDYGVVFSNVDTAIHALEAVKTGTPLIERYVTVFGGGITSPKNLKVRLGTPLNGLIEVCGGFQRNPGRLVLGNPLDGMAQFALDRPVLKDTRWLWVQPEEEVVKESYRACINCGDCIEVCPVGLMPNFLSKFCEFGKFEEAAKQYDLFTCIDCGLCAYVCPARRPIVHLINYGRRELSLKETENGNA